jgi:hypothetical protein
MKRISINDNDFDIDISLDELEKLAKEIVIQPCYVPGNFPWEYPV